MAPEVVNRKGHDVAADWWSFGVLMVSECIRPFALQMKISNFFFSVYAYTNTNSTRC